MMGIGGTRTRCKLGYPRSVILGTGMLCSDFLVMESILVLN